MTLLRIMAGVSRLLGRVGEPASSTRSPPISCCLRPPRGATRAPICAARWVVSRAPADRFRHVLTFATTIHDRVYLLNERFDLFDISIEGEELMRTALASGKGGFLMGAHMGSFEVTSAFGRHQPGTRSRDGDVRRQRPQDQRHAGGDPAGVKPEIISLGHIEAMLKIA